MPYCNMTRGTAIVCVCLYPVMFATFGCRLEPLSFPSMLRSCLRIELLRAEHLLQFIRHASPLPSLGQFHGTITATVVTATNTYIRCDALNIWAPHLIFILLSLEKLIYSTSCLVSYQVVGSSSMFVVHFYNWTQTIWQYTLPPHFIIIVIHLQLNALNGLYVSVCVCVYV